MNTNLIFSAIILIILISLQYTLNLILKEVRDIRKRLIIQKTELEEGKERKVWIIWEKKKCYLVEKKLIIELRN